MLFLSEVAWSWNPSDRPSPKTVGYRQDRLFFASFDGRTPSTTTAVGPPAPAGRSAAQKILNRRVQTLCAMLSVLTSAAALNGPLHPEKISRRTLLAGALTTPLLVAGPPKSHAASTEGPQDPRTAWSFFGLVAPPIQGTWSYDTLVDQAKAENLATIQTAVSHDCIIATTHDGMRFASMVADKAVPTLLMDCEKPDGRLPFLVLPMDENRAAVRDVATQLLNLLGVLWLADQADLLPWDTTPYGSIAEREAAQRGGEKVKKKLLGQLRSALEKKKKAPARREAARCTCAVGLPGPPAPRPAVVSPHTDSQGAAVAARAQPAQGDVCTPFCQAWSRTTRLCAVCWAWCAGMRPRSSRRRLGSRGQRWRSNLGRCAPRVYVWHGCPQR